MTPRPACITLLLCIATLAACGGAATVAPRSAPLTPTVPTPEARPASWSQAAPPPLNELPESSEATAPLARTVAAMEASKWGAPSGEDMAAINAWATSEMRPWVAQRVQDLARFDEDLRRFVQEGHSPSERMVAAGWLGRAHESTAWTFRSAPIPMEMAGDPDLRETYLQMFEDKSAGWLESARVGYDACAKLRAQVQGPALRWAEYCEQRIKALTSAGPKWGPHPATSASALPAPQFKPLVMPNSTRWLLRMAGNYLPLGSEDREKLRAAAHKWLEATHGGNVLTATEVEAARSRLSQGSPRAQFDDLAVALHETHPEMAVVLVGAGCTGPFPRTCELSVSFRRPGAPFSLGAPPDLPADTTSQRLGTPGFEVQDWIAALGKLTPSKARPAEPGDKPQYLSVLAPARAPGFAWTSVLAQGAWTDPNAPEVALKRIEASLTVCAVEKVSSDTHVVLDVDASGRTTTIAGLDGLGPHVECVTRLLENLQFPAGRGVRRVTATATISKGDSTSTTSGR